MITKGDELNERVWSLFEKAGFDTKPNSDDPKEYEIEIAKGKYRTPDLLAEIEAADIRIIGSNKSGKNLSGSLTKHIHDYEKLMQKSGAGAALFVLTQLDVTKDERAYALERNIYIWTEDELLYYEAIVAAVGSTAKYEIISSFGLSTEEEKPIYNVPAIRFRHPRNDSEVQFYVFSAPPAWLLRTCVVSRRAQGNPDAYQRILRGARLKSIGKFVAQDDALLPPNIIVHFGEEVSWHAFDDQEPTSGSRPPNLSRPQDCKIGYLSIPMKYASMEIIDGQHRLFGFTKCESATRVSFNLVVLGIQGLSSSRRRDTFVAINHNAKRIDPNLVAYLKYTDDEALCQGNPELMAIKLAVELNKRGALKGRIRLLDVVGKANITLKGISGYELRSLVGPKGLLRRYYGNDSRALIRLLASYFGHLKSVFPEQWRDYDKHIIFTNRGVSAFLKLLKSMLKTSNGKLTQKATMSFLLALRDEWKGTWETKSLANSYIGSAGWKDFHLDLVKVIRKKYKNFKP